MRWIIALAALVLLAGPARAQVSTRGVEVPALAAFDSTMLGLMERHGLPGGAIAVAKDGRLVLGRGYGLADVESGRAVEPTTRFRIASLSKLATATAALTLVQERRLNIDARMVSIIGDLVPPEAAGADPRLRNITVRMLLQHTGGWDRDASGDFEARDKLELAASALGLAMPIHCMQSIPYALSHSLDFVPGARHAYSNFGYCVLARIIERVSGQSYHEFVGERVWTAAGVRGAAIGGTAREISGPDEAVYYDHPGAPLTRSVLDQSTVLVGRPYGQFWLEGRDGAAGWVVSAVEYLRFFVHLEGRREPPLLSTTSVAMVDQEPWRPVPPRREGEWRHFGNLPGTAAAAFHMPNGVSVVVLFNSRPQTAAFDNEVTQAIRDAVAAVSTWPEGDGFD
jgi:N-acyl-D-amino-acid deacylase